MLEKDILERNPYAVSFEIRNNIKAKQANGETYEPN